MQPALPRRARRAPLRRRAGAAHGGRVTSSRPPCPRSLDEALLEEEPHRRREIGGETAERVLRALDRGQRRKPWPSRDALDERILGRPGAAGDEALRPLREEEVDESLR